MTHTAHHADIANAYEALYGVLELELGDQAPTALAHVCRRDADTEDTPAGRRGFLSYLRWCIVNPDQILMPPELHCACGGSGWYETHDGHVERCPDHLPPVNVRPSPVAEHRETAVAGRERDEARYR